MLKPGAFCHRTCVNKYESLHNLNSQTENAFLDQPLHYDTFILCIKPFLFGKNIFKLAKEIKDW